MKLGHVIVFVEKLFEQIQCLFGILEPSVFTVDLSQAKHTGSDGVVILGQRGGHSLQLRLRIFHKVFKKLENLEIKV